MKYSLSSQKIKPLDEKLLSMQLVFIKIKQINDINRDSHF